MFKLYVHLLDGEDTRDVLVLRHLSAQSFVYELHNAAKRALVREGEVEYAWRVLDQGGSCPSRR